MTWPVESIPDTDWLFRRVHVHLLSNRQNQENIPPIVFWDHNGISVDWSKYSTPNESRQRAKDPSQNGIIQIGVQAILSFRSLSVVHAPIQENRAHANILGMHNCSKVDQTDIRKRLARIAQWALKPY